MDQSTIGSTNDVVKVSKLKLRREDGGGSGRPINDNNNSLKHKLSEREVMSRRRTNGLLNYCWTTCLLLLWCRGVSGVTELAGQTVRDMRTLSLAESPYLVTGDVVVEREGEMRIEPGVELGFLSGVGLTVRGILKAEGLEGRVIRMTRSSSTDDSTPDFRIPSDIRLVDGPSINEGRLQLFHRGKWRSVCTNSRNWTRTDFEVACRQMGFRGGNFSTWFPRNNDSSQLSYEQPRCSPQSASLATCDWNSKRMGSGVCDYHYDIGIQCEPQSLRPLQHWSGVRFDSAQFFFMRTTKVSKSSIRHVEILYAGWNNTGNFTSALEVTGVPPAIDRLTVKWSAFTGINISHAQSAVDIVNCHISDNRGYGIYANTSVGMVRLLDSTVLANGADGVRYVFHDVTRPLYNYEAVDFCSHKNQGMSQPYPLVLNLLNEANDSPNRRSCTQTLMAADWGEQLSLHFAYMETSSEWDGGTVEVRDGQFAQSPLLINVTIRNNTWPQTVVSTAGSLYIKFSPALNTYVTASLRITARKGNLYDLNVTSSTIKENLGRGVAVENLRSMVHIVSSFITANRHVAGVHVLGGVGDVNITRTEISSNIGDGVNISYSGGRRNITSCNVIKNSGRGVALWLNDTSAFYPADQYTVLAYSTFVGGGGVAFLVGNYCRHSVLNITYNTVQDSDEVGVQIDACWRRVEPPDILTLYATNNRFLRLGKPALVINPAVNIEASIKYNLFKENTRGSLYISNPDKEELETLTSNVDVSENIFEGNVGQYVAKLGLSQYSLVQRLRFARNELRKNKVKERYSVLTPRHRVGAVVTVSSSNVRLERNLFENPDSKYEIGSHLVDHYAIIDAQLCYFGKYLESESLKVYNRIFDSKDRYDLATVLVTPYLLVPYKDEDRLISSNFSNYLVVDFQPDESPFRLGGTVYGRQELDEGEYTVWRDIYVRSQSELVLKRKTTLRFAPSVGLMVQGKLTVQGESGDHDQQVIFTLDEKSLDAASDWSEVTVRLADGQAGADVNDGVLEVNIGGKWGTVCNYGWSFQSASLSCASLGLVANPADWLMLRTQLASGNQARENELPILWSNVRCGDHDTDLSTCQVEGIEDFEGSCTHAQDVVLRCYRQAWAGLRLGPMADRSDIKGARVERAGVLDWATGAFRPAVQIDLNRHFIQELGVGRNLESGLGIIMADSFTDVFTRKVMSSVFEGNLGHGLITRTPSLTITNSIFRDNRGNGLMYDPSLGHEEQRDMSRWVDRSRTDSVVILTPRSIAEQSRFLRRGEQLFFIFDARTPSTSNSTTFKLTTDPDNTFGLQILTQLHNGTNETVRVENGRPEVPGNSWEFRKDDLAFPLVTGDAQLTIEYERYQRHGHGDAILLVTVVERSTMIPPPVPTIRIDSTAISTNKGAGLAAVHYSFAVGPLEQRRLRIRNESVEVVRSKFRDNKMAAILIDSPFFDIQDGPVANITYTVNWTSFDGNDGGGIVQTSRDLHGANNIFHWLLCHNEWRSNDRGGLALTVPYTAEYNSQLFHTVFLTNNTFEDNRNFQLMVGGHYARVEARLNRFRNNFCYRGLMQVRGMEKELLIWENIFERNTCEFVAEFNADSHAEMFGTVPAVFRKNRIQLNRYGTNVSVSAVGGGTPTYSPRSYTVGLRGIQKVDVNNNVFINNTMDYEFLAGLITGSLTSSVNVKENWWGTTEPYYIRKRIFDFDDWNSFAGAIFSPFSATPEFYSSVVHEVFNASYVDVENLGGRLYNSTYLRRRERPYVIRSDLTVMPGATLHIEAGVELQFFPSIGILVLGALRAIGHESLPIRMGPFNRNTYYYSGRTSYQRREAVNRGDMASVRLCVGQRCGQEGDQGFVELYNVTTRQWVPICDPYFTQHNAEVVCKELGFDPLGAMFIYGPRVEMDPSYVSRVVHWPEPKQCSGVEDYFDECSIRFSGFFRPTYPCSYKDDFVFVYCGRRNLAAGSEYWGGIRFSTPNYEPIISPTYDASYTVLMEHSALEHLDIIGAGILHNEKCPAVFAVSRTPTTFMFVNISNSASHGVSIIAPTESMVIYGSRVEKNLGVGINVAVLYGESRVSASSSFAPLTNLFIPYNVFGLVDICSPDKILPVNQRILLYYKYNHNSADCIKIFTSMGGLRRMGLRLLHFNLLNTTLLSPLADSLRLFDGNLYQQSSPSLIAQLTSETNNERLFFQSTKPSLTVRLHASGGSELLGFVAEVVTVPTMSSGYRERHHNVTSCVVSSNVLGAVHYSNVGEVGPHASLLNSQFKDNGISLYGNFSTASSAIDLDLQNTNELYVQNNLLKGNQGGLRIVADSETMAASLSAFVANNLMFRNEKWPVLEVKGRKTSPFQMAVVFRNAISQNLVPYHDVVRMDSVMSNFSFNFVVNNTGDHVMEVVAFDQVSQPSFQVLTYNSWWNNWALRWDQRATLVLIGSGQRIEENILFNPYNDFEMMIRNISNVSYGNPQQVARIDATNNWWGYNQTWAVSGRIWDGLDDPGLIQVVYQPFYISNATLISGKCPPGWRMIGKTCFIYIGGVLEYSEAEEYCQSINGSIPYVEKDSVYEILGFVARQQVNYDLRISSVWVRTLDTPMRGCSSLRGARDYITPCNSRLPVLCETDPDVYLDPGDWGKFSITYAAIGAVAAAIGVVLIIVLFWLCKSRRRHEEKLERRNSIRSASSRSLTGSSTFGSVDISKKKAAVAATRPVQLQNVIKANGSVDSIAKSPSRFGSSQFNSSQEDNRSYEVFEAKNNQVEYSDDYDKYLTAAVNRKRTPSTDFLDDTRTTQTPISSVGYGFDNKCYLETHFAAEETPEGSTSSSSLVDDPVETKRALERGGYSTAPSSSTTSSQDYYRARQHALLETEM